MTKGEILVHSEVVFRAGVLAGKSGRVVSIKGDMITVELNGARMRVGRSELQPKTTTNSHTSGEERPILPAGQALDAFHQWLAASPFSALVPHLRAEETDAPLLEELSVQTGFPLPQSARRFLRSHGLLRFDPISHPALQLAGRGYGLRMFDASRGLAAHARYLTQSQQGQPDNRLPFAEAGESLFYWEDRGDKGEKKEFAIGIQDARQPAEPGKEPEYPSFDAWVSWLLDDLKRALSAASPEEVARAAATHPAPTPRERQPAEEAQHLATEIAAGRLRYEDANPTTPEEQAWQTLLRHHPSADTARRALEFASHSPITDLLYRLPEEGRRGRLAITLECLRQAGRLPSQPALMVALVALERQATDPDAMTPSARKGHLDKAAALGWQKRGFLSGATRVEALWGRALAWLLGRQTPEQLSAALEVGTHISKAVGGKLSPELVLRELTPFVFGR